MIAFEKLKFAQEKNNSKLCVGLDSTIEKLPKHIEKNVNGLFEFNKKIIDATIDLVCSYKINFAFYEQYGSDGIDLIKKTINYINHNHQDKIILNIADAKRGDIGNTSAAYSKAILIDMGFDSITVNPLMGSDCVLPFLEDKEKFVFLLALTSNKGSQDFQMLNLESGIPLYKKIIEISSKWADENQLGYVIGATHPEMLKGIREIIPNRLLLFPGIGTQGGNATELLKYNSHNPYLINVSRDIIYTSNEINFEEKVNLKAENYKNLFNSIDENL